MPRQPASVWVGVHRQAMKPLKSKHAVEWAWIMSIVATHVVLDGELCQSQSQTVMMIC